MIEIDYDRAIVDYDRSNKAIVDYDRWINLKKKKIFFNNITHWYDSSLYVKLVYEHTLYCFH